MPTFEIKNATDAQDFVRGCTFYGTGGGGSPEYGLDMIMRVLNEGSRIRIVDVSEVKDDAWSCSAFGMGSIAPRTQKVLDEMKSMGLVTPTVNYKLAGAIKELQDYSGKKISVIAPVEIGGANTPDPVATAAHLGLAVVDGDYAGGRAIPEALQTTPTIEGNEIMVPLASVDEWGNTVILKKAINNAASEKIGKLVAVLAYGNLAGQATYLFSGTRMKKLIVPGTLSRAFATGKKIRQLKERGMGFEEFAKAVGGHYVFKGKVKSKDEENRDAEYYWGSYTMEGIDEFKGHTFKVWFKNENHMTWLDKKPYIMSPDSVDALDAKTLEPIINPRIDAGHQLAIFAFRAHPRFRTAKALLTVGPSHFGFKEKYVPMEEVLARK